MPQETETVTGNPEAPQENGGDAQKPSDGASENGAQLLVQDTQPSVQEAACVLKQTVLDEVTAPSGVTEQSPRSPAAEATEEFLLNEKSAYESEPAAPKGTPVPEPRTPVNSEESESSPTEDPQVSIAPQIVEVSVYSETVVVAPQVDEPVALNGTSAVEPESQLPTQLSNGQSKYDPEVITNDNARAQVVLNGTIANELAIEDYRLPDVVEVKKNFEYVERSGQNIAQAPPKKGALSTSLDSQGVRQAYQDVRHDGSDTQWAVFKFEGPRIITSATGENFGEFKNHFGDDERAFGYIRVQTGDEMSKRAKFIFLTWVGPSVSVLKRAKMSTDKALIKDILSNFAVELQTENIGDINLQNFEAELDKAAGAHYGTGVRS